MSIFDTATEQPQDAPKQEQEAAPTTESFLNKLVEERGEKWGDPEVIAKGKLEADAHIANLERQLAEMREDLGKEEYSKKLLDALQNKAGSTSPNTVAPKDNNSASDEPNTTAEADVDVESLVEQTLAKREREAKVAQNIASVEQALTESFGTEARAMVQQKAQDLGLSIERMQELAAESPQAFLSLVGSAPARESNADLSSAKNTVSGFNNVGRKDWNYYQNLRRTNPNQYYSPKIQNEMMKSLSDMGDKFYG